MAGSAAAQVIVTSHSASILSRVEPEEVRYFRVEPSAGTTSVQSIVLPADRGEAYKYVREAVRAYPELYFARLVILGEGDSEEIVIPKVAESLGVPIDKGFVAMVPLGGRHVNHLWRLLHGLSIPYITLLDLDWEREGGGWGRVKYACEQLLQLGAKLEDLLPVAGGTVLTDAQVAQMHTWQLNPAMIPAWTARLEEFDVFFSAPLDLDFMMLEAFPAAYQGTAPSGGGPRIPTAPSPEYDQRLADARKRVLKEMGSDGMTYTAAQRAAFIWYAYLFLGKGKPTSHLLAMEAVKPADLANEAPAVLKRLVGRARTILQLVEKEEVNAAGTS